MIVVQPLGSVSGIEFDAVVALWRRGQRKLATSFGGTSMLPAIAPDQQVVVDCGLEPQPGEVAVFRLDDRIGVHRVVARTAEWLLTWGDANPLPDEPIESKRVIGTIRCVPAFKGSLRRALLLRFLVQRGISLAVVTQRVRFLYRVRSAWASGAFHFASKGVKLVIRRTTPW